MHSGRVLGTPAVTIVSVVVAVVSVVGVVGCTDDANDTNVGDDPGGVPGVEDQGYLDTSLPAITDPQATPAPNPAAGGGGAPAPDDGGTGSVAPTGTTVP